MTSGVHAQSPQIVWLKSNIGKDQKAKKKNCPYEMQPSHALVMVMVNSTCIVHATKKKNNHPSSKHKKCEKCVAKWNMRYEEVES